MKVTVDSTCPQSVEECEKIRTEIKAHQAKVRWFEQELKEIKRIFKGPRLQEQRFLELRNRRRALGALKDRHQNKIKELRARRQSRNES